jgi:hypothetical protein
MKLTISAGTFFVLFFLKNYAFYILLKYLLVDGNTGIKPLTGINEILIYIFLSELALSVPYSNVIFFE